MKSASFFTLALAAIIPACYGLDATVTELGPTQALIVKVSYIIDGVEVSPAPCNYTGKCLPAPAPCENDGNCLPVLGTEQTVANADKVVVSFSFNSSFPDAKKGVTGIDLRACYSPVSMVDRPWRKDKKAINPSESNQCKKLMNKAAPLPAEDGTFTWTLPNNLPGAIFNVRAYTVCGMDGDDKKYCSWGQSKGYFQTTIWDTVPTWLVVTTIPLMCLGPAFLALWFGGRYIKNRGKGE